LWLSKIAWNIPFFFYFMQKILATYCRLVFFWYV